MARISAQRSQQLAQSLPTAEATAARVRSYMERADIQIPQFAQLVGYSEAAIRQVINLNYGERSDLPIREAMEIAMDRYPVGEISLDREGRLYETENVRQIRQIFDHCHKYQAMAFVYGPPGSQKTFVLEHLVAEFNRRELGREQGSGPKNLAFMVRASVGIRPRDLVAKICKEIGAHSGCTLQACMSGLRQRLRGARTIIVLDEAQLCGIEALEAIRELQETEQKMGVLLAGSHALKRFFDARASELEQFNSRLDAGIELSGVSDACARAILAAEIPGLSDDEVAEWIATAKVPDIYSRDRKRTYLSVRRLFKSIASFHRLAAEAEGATA